MGWWKEGGSGLPALVFFAGVGKRCPSLTDMFGQDQPSDLQQQILRVYDRNPDMSISQIASRCNCSASYVRETINDYRPSVF